MLMPKATVDKDCLFLWTPHNVWLSGKFFRMNPEPVAQLVNDGPHHALGLHIERSNTPHVLGAALLGKVVGHYCQPKVCSMSQLKSFKADILPFSPSPSVISLGLK